MVREIKMTKKLYCTIQEQKSHSNDKTGTVLPYKIQVSQNKRISLLANPDILSTVCSNT